MENIKPKNLTPAQEKVLNLLESGKWYDPESTFLPGVYRLAYLCRLLHEKGYLTREARFRESGNWDTAYFVYQKNEAQNQQ